ncbi:hypothetical protein LIER_34933 [Lithospermum erythrorhizon]|uniref:Uncharacterized protein n=1 Tax=Lithospermum erythrorhizon TaxID=34254 RepID=A0AAV3NGJ4_LITER
MCEGLKPHLVQDKNEVVANIDKKAHLWLLKHVNSPRRWCKDFFPLAVKSDMLCNNLSESFNFFILDIRDKPIITMLETIRTKLMERIRDRKVAMERKSNPICPRIVKILDDNFTLSDKMEIEWNGGTLLRLGHMVTELQQLPIHVVDECYSIARGDIKGWRKRKQRKETEEKWGEHIWKKANNGKKQKKNGENTTETGAKKRKSKLGSRIKEHIAIVNDFMTKWDDGTKESAPKKKRSWNK